MNIDIFVERKMTSRELTTKSAFYDRYFMLILEMMEPLHMYDDFVERTWQRYKISHPNQQLLLHGQKFFRLFDDSIADIILENFPKIPALFHHDLLIVNENLSNEVKAEICHRYIMDIYRNALILSSVDKANILSFNYMPTPRRYPKFFEEGFKIFPFDREQRIDLHELANFSEEFFITMLQNWSDDYSIGILCDYMSWNFIEQYLLPIVIAQEGRNRQEYIDAFLFHCLKRDIVPKNIVDAFLISDPLTYLILLRPKTLTKELLIRLERDIFDRLESDEEFVANFTPEIVEQAVHDLPFSLDQPNIPYGKIIKMFTILVLLQSVKYDMTDGALERLLTENWPLLMTLTVREKRRYIFPGF